MNNGLLGIPSKILSLIRVIITNVFPASPGLIVKSALNQTANVVEIQGPNGNVQLCVPALTTPTTTTYTLCLGPRNSTAFAGCTFSYNASTGTLSLTDPSNSSIIFLCGTIGEESGKITISGTGVDLGSGSPIRFSSTSLSTGTKDVGVTRSSAGILKVTNGSSGSGGLIADTIGDTSGHLLLDNFNSSLGKIRLSSTSTVVFHTTTNVTSGVDLGLARDSAGVMRVTDGSTGDGKVLHKGMQVREGSNQTMGLSVLVGGTVTVNTTQVTANSRIFLTIDSPAGTLGFVYVSARVAGTSFTITSSSAIDTSSVAWLIVEPA